MMVPGRPVTSISKQSLEKKKKKIIDKKDNVVLTFGRLNQWIKLVAWLRLATPIVTPLFMFEHTLFSYMYSCTSYNTRHLSSLAFFEPWEILRINVSRRATKLIFEIRRVIMAIYVMHDVWPGCDHRLHLLIPVFCITFGQNLWVTSVPACSTNGRRARQILFLHTTPTQPRHANFIKESNLTHSLDTFLIALLQPSQSRQLQPHI